MAFPLRELIAPATGAVTSDAFNVGRATRPEESRPITVIASNLVGSETADIQIKTGDSSKEWIDVYEGGSQMQLTATNNVEVINAPGVFRIVKGVTAGSCGIYLATPAAPGLA